jgi:hypothetical protein
MMKYNVNINLKGYFSINLSGTDCSITSSMDKFSLTNFLPSWDFQPSVEFFSSFKFTGFTSKCESFIYTPKLFSSHSITPHDNMIDYGTIVHNLQYNIYDVSCYSPYAHIYIGLLPYLHLLVPVLLI